MTGEQTPIERETDRIEDVLAELDLDEKIELVHGAVDPDGRATGYVPANDRLDVPSLSMVDGPMGIRAVPSTAFPASIALAATWDPALAEEFGEALGAEARGAGQDALLAPGFNAIRVPQCGRAFEYYSEDPFLASRLGVGTVDGIQSAGVMATAKHFVANDQETDRHHVSATMSERTLREIYLPAFEAAVRDADVASVMAAYNRINGTYATEHRRLLTDLLKDEWDFDGFVVADWWATHDGVAAAEAGLDLDMPGMPVYEWQEHGSGLFSVVDALPDAEWVPKRALASVPERIWQPENPNPNVLDDSPFDEPLRAAIEAGDLEESILDDKIRRLLRQYERFGLFEDDRPEGELDTAAHHDLAGEIARRGTVLLQNDGGALPIDDSADVALIGPHADEPKVGGGGSSEVDPTRATSPLGGLRERIDRSGSVTVERGIERVGDASMHGLDLPEFTDLGGETPRLEDAMAAAREADVAVVVARDLASEGEDRSLTLPGAQDDLISAVAAVADRTVVVLNTAGMVEMPWVDDVDAVLETWYPGQEDGRALAAVLFGDADPSGRLPVTFGARAEEYPAKTEAQYPGVDGEAIHSEGVFVGYRHFDEEAIDPLFPFGHGLSYADFEYRDASVSVPEDGAASVQVTVENVGERAGRDVVQAYVAEEDPAVDRPPQELAAFEPIALDPGESTTVSLSFDERSFAYYDVSTEAWAVDGGKYELRLGRSSRDLRECVELQMPET